MKALLNLKLIMAVFSLAISFSLVSGQEINPNNLDIAEFVRKFNAAKESRQQEITNGSVLVSFSMKEESLHKLIEQTNKVKIPLVLRGLVDNSAKETLRRINAIDPQGLGNWKIDPRLFRKYNVSAVPAFVIAKQDQHVLVRGDISLDYALSIMAREDNELARKANILLRKLTRK